jgi:serine/threonine protein kinase
MPPEKSTRTFNPHSATNAAETKVESHQAATTGTTNLGPGEMVGRYLLTAPLGSGAEGQVFLALHPTLRVPVAVKLIRPASSATSAARFRQYAAEANLLAQFDHPNIVRVMDFDDDPQRPFLVMAFVEGLNLAELIAQSGQLNLARALHIIEQLALGLQAAQKRGLVHRDVKPGNAIVNKDNQVKLVDFGAALLTSEVAPQDKVIGTMIYMAPEQFDTNAPIDHRADIYALGATLYQCLTGKQPFSGTSMHQVLMQKVQFGEYPGLLAPLPEPNPQLNQQVSELIRRMMDPDPNSRPANYDELLDELRSLRAKCTASNAEIDRVQSELTGSSLLSPTLRARPNSPSGSNSDDELSLLLREAGEAHKNGDKATCREALLAAKARFPKHERVWLALASLATPAEAPAILQAGLREVPGSSKLQAALTKASANNANQQRRCGFCGATVAKSVLVCSQCGGRDTLGDPTYWFKAPPMDPTKIDRAIAHYEDLVRTKADLRSRCALAVAYLNVRRYGAAVEQLRAASIIKPDQPILKAQLDVLATHNGRKVIAVVDDSPTVRKMVGMLLSEHNYEVLPVSDGNEAVERLLLIQPDLVILDIQMPGRDGYEVCRWMRAQPMLKHTTVVMFSGGMFDRIRGRLAGTSHFMPKPFDSDKLVQMIGDLCPSRPGR